MTIASKLTAQLIKIKLISLDFTNMSETAEQLKLELSRLSVKDRAEIAYFLLHSLDEGMDDEFEDAWDAELTQRLEEIRNGTADGESLSQVFSELREKYS